MPLAEHHLRGDLSAPARSRRLVRLRIEDHPRLHEIILAVSELVANAVTHASTYTRTSGLSLYIEDDDSHVRITVAHEGPAFDPVPHRKPSGLALVDNSVDRWGIEQHNGHVEVWFEVDRVPAEAER